MSGSEIEVSMLELQEGLSPRVATWCAQLTEVRKNLLERLDKVPDEAIDFTPHERQVETIGTLLLHIAAIEWSWIFEDIDGLAMDEERWKYAFALRPDVDLPQLKEQGKEFYVDRLHQVRADVINRISKLSDADLDRLLVGNSKWHFSIEWILYHIVEHEAMHLGQINMLVRLYRLEMGS